MSSTALPTRLRRAGLRRAQLLLGAAAVASGLHRRRRRPLWLFGGFVGAAFGDNSAALFRHLRAHRPDIDAVWAIDSGADDAAAAAAVGPVVDHGGVDAAALALQADVLVISHGLHDLPGYASRLARGLRVRVGHGLTAFKKTKPPTGRTSDDVARLFDVVPVASPFERDNKLQWGITAASLPVCGVCRFDDLVARAREAPPQARLLYMPTWRDSWDASGDNDVVRQLRAFLSSERLDAVLARAGVELDVYAHRLIGDGLRARLSRANGSRVHVVAKGADVQALLARSRALLTDYSSVTWDMLYLDRPVGFFAPDVDDYERDRGGYFDLRHDLPGPVARDVDGAVDVVAALCDGVVSDAARRWQERAFSFRDDDNCARVVAAVEAALARRAERGRA